MNLRKYIEKGSERSIEAKKNIISSVGLRVISILASLQLVPLTIDYVSAEMYGIWLTLSSIIAWASYFDLGFSNGFRNRFAEARANGDDLLAKKYLSTTYAALTIVFTVIFLIISLVNTFVNWSNMLNVSQDLNESIRSVFFILSFFFCLNFIVSTINIFLTAMQKPALSSFLQTMGQVVALAAICILTKTTEANLSVLAFALSGVPCLLLIVFSIIFYKNKRFEIYAPSIRCVDFTLAKDIVYLGGKFFIITVSLVVIFQLINILLTRLQGPLSVTQYNIAFKYFNMLYMASVIVVTPFWTAFTDAYTKKDFTWMISIFRKLELFLLCLCAGCIFLLCCAPLFYSIWIGDKVEIPYIISISTGVYVLAQCAGTVYMYMINGIGKIKLQLYTYVIFAVLSFPMLYYSCKWWGIPGILMMPSAVYIVQAILMRIQLKKLFNGTANGIWNE